MVDKDTDHRKAQEKITRTSFVKLDFDPMHVHKKYRSIKKQNDRGEITIGWKIEVQPGKKSTLYKTHKNDNPLELLSMGSNRAVSCILKVTFNVNMNEKKKKFQDHKTGADSFPAC